MSLSYRDDGLDPAAGGGPKGLPKPRSLPYQRAYRRLVLALEFSALFIGLPLLFYFEPVPIPKLPALAAITLLCWLALRHDTTFDRNALTRTRPLREFLPGMVLRASLAAVALTAFVIWIDPDLFLAFPRIHPYRWGLVVLLYPFLSALPQELIYRTFLYHRYTPLFGTGPARLAASTMAFAFLHIMYDNAFALVSTLLAGALLSRTYQRSRSLPATTVEHALYGWIIFTVGLGFCFYEGH